MNYLQFNINKESENDWINKYFLKKLIVLTYEKLQRKLEVN